MEVGARAEHDHAQRHGLWWVGVNGVTLDRTGGRVEARGGSEGEKGGEGSRGGEGEVKR